MIKKEYEIKNLHCAGCAGKIQNEFSKLKAVKNCTIDFYKGKVILELQEEIEEREFLKDLNKIADRLEPGTKINPILEIEEDFHEEREREKIAEEKKEKREKLSLTIGIVLFIGALFIQNKIYKDILLVIAYLITGIDIIYKSFLNIRRGDFLDENFLMTIATFGAFALGDFSESAGVMIFYKIGEFFQDMAVKNSKKSIEKLMSIKPEYANLKIQGGKIEKVSPKKVKIGDIVVVKPGEKIPLDGIVISGESSIDNSALTGESLPLDVERGKEVLSGSINKTGVLEIRVLKTYAQSTVSKIIELVENAGTKKAKAEKFITKFARYYTPIVVALALIVGLVVPTIIGNYSLWFGRALIFLVISCPCALVLSVPLTFFSSIGRASKIGILIKGGNYLEKLNDIGNVVFDKTGTLTMGKFKVVDIETFGEREERLLELAKAGEYYSNHPIGQAILNYGDIKIEEENIEGHIEKPGYGVITRYQGNEVIIGNFKMMQEYGIEVPKTEEIGTVVYVAENEKAIGRIIVADIPKESSKLTIKELNDMGINTYMLTGDNEKTGKKIGEELGIPETNIYTHLLPQDKVSVLENIKNTNKKGTIFVGDGINDAPVLAISDVGISMGKMGSDIAVESSDIVLMNDDPYKIIEVLKLAKKNRKVVLENVILALGIKVIVMILGVMGLANLWLAIFADVGVSIIAVINASKLLKSKTL